MQSPLQYPIRLRPRIGMTWRGFKILSHMGEARDVYVECQCGQRFEGDFLQLQCPSCHESGRGKPNYPPREYTSVLRQQRAAMPMRPLGPEYQPTYPPAIFQELRASTYERQILPASEGFSDKRRKSSARPQYIEVPC